jgi:DNA polymerase-3 subunit epsilon
MESFVTIDFETANESRDSPCEIGLVRFVDGQPTETFQSLLYQERFAPFNVMLHGIKPSDVKGAPTIDDLLPEVAQFIGGSPLVAHNAAFDMRILQIALSRSPLDFSTSFFCTLVLARHTLSLPENGLAYVSEQLGIDHPGDHRALHDATTCGFVATTMLRNGGFTALSGLAEAANVRPGTISANDVVGSVKKSTGTGAKLSRERLEEILKSIPEEELYLDPDFEGKNIVFTGALSGMTQGEAKLAVMKAGGWPQGNVTKATNMLVYGYQDPRVLRGKPMSGKRLDAAALCAKGFDIEIVDEALFLEMLSSA